MLSRRALIASGALGLLPWRLREAFAAARLRGPMVGHVAPTEAFIWVYTGRHPDVWVNYRKKATPVSTTRRVRVVASNGHKAVLTGLEPDTTYVYRVTYRGRSDDDYWRGTFRTPPPIGTPHAFRFATSSCMKHNVKYQDAWLTALKQAPDFHFLLGDNAYVDSTNVGDHWKHHTRMRGVWQFAQFVRNTPTYSIWDDHDFAGNDTAGANLGSRGRLLDTHKELWPNPYHGTPDIPGAFFKLQRGDVDFFVLDGRYYRTHRKARNDSRKRMLGDKQFAWFAREIRASKAPFKFIATGSTIDAKDTDIWKEYTFALQRVYRLIRDERIGGVVWLTGDLHDCRLTVHPKQETGFYDMLEVVSSGVANGAYFRHAVLDVDTRPKDPTLTARILNPTGVVHAERTFRASEMQVT